MADSNSEPPRCPCGFWGSPQTMGLCSKCYKEHQTKNEQVDQSNPNTEKTSLSTKALSAVQPMDTTEPTAQETGAKDNSTVSSEPSKSDSSTDSKSENNADSMADAEQSTSGEPSSENSEKREQEDTVEDMRPPQKNKKRCFQCNSKLELAIRQIGKCRCDYVFCQLHRLPEQHDCIFDHKEKGRQEAREKMVSPKKHMGTSLKRIDSDS